MQCLSQQMKFMGHLFKNRRSKISIRRKNWNSPSKRITEAEGELDRKLEQIPLKEEITHGILLLVLIKTQDTQ